ncbi:hypothetical protein [Prevotella sp. P3-120]|uniref:hypothetical protein n=1 Tax=Prevotella sp. P3-120 TaxID=2024220 RepID=UPI000B97888E|nr:hypothetical protein [Prevotella sp. P3-120]
MQKKITKMISAAEILKKKGIEQKKMDMDAFNEVVENFFLTHDAKDTILLVPKRFIEMKNPPEGDFLDFLDVSIWERKAEDPNDEFSYINYSLMLRERRIRPMLIVNEPFIGNAAGWLRDFCGFVVKSRMYDKKKEYIVSLPV